MKGLFALLVLTASSFIFIFLTGLVLAAAWWTFTQGWQVLP